MASIMHNEEQQIYNLAEDDPEYDAIAGVNRAVCYVMGRGMEFRVDLAGSATDESINDLTKETPIRLTCTSDYDGTLNTCDYDTMDISSWSATDDYDIETDSNITDTITDHENFTNHWTILVKDFSGSWVTSYTEGPSSSYSMDTDHQETTNGRTSGLLVTYDVQVCPEDEQFVQDVIDYACEYADGESEEEGAIVSLMDGMAADFTYCGSCFFLSNDLARMCHCLGIECEKHRWDGDPFEVVYMVSIPIQGIGLPTAQSYVWNFHAWNFANGKTRDPSSNTTFDGGWSEYENHLFVEYIDTSTRPYTVIPNPLGSSNDPCAHSTPDPVTVPIGTTP